MPGLLHELLHHHWLFARARFLSSADLPIITLFTKRKEVCSLCEVAKQDIKSIQSKFVYKEIYIDDPENTEWNKKYRYEIPVLHVNGKFAMKHRVNKHQLEQILRNAS